MNYGTLAKLPRQATLNDLQNLHVIPISDLLRTDKYKVEEAVPANSQQVGSVSFDFVDEERLSRLETFAKTFISDRVEANKGYATVHDFAIALAILMFTKLNPSKYKDGSQPTARIRTLWACLVEQGVAKRAFDAQRFSVIRNTLSELGLIDWRDNRYYPGQDGKKGQSMKWDLTDSFMALLVEAISVKEVNSARPAQKERSSSGSCSGSSSTVGITHTHPCTNCFMKNGKDVLDKVISGLLNWF